MLLGAVAFASVMLLLAGAWSVVYFHLHPRCSEQVLTEAASPDQRWKAAVLERRCGEDAPFLVHVNLRPASDPIRLGYFSGHADEGEIFVTEEVFQDGVQSANATPSLEWSAPDHLIVQCSRCGAAFAQKRNQHFQNVLVEYRATP